MRVSSFGRMNISIAIGGNGQTTRQRFRSIHRKWTDTLGYFVPPHFYHWYVDTWTSKVARKIDRYYRLENMKVKYEDVPDDTTNRSRKTWTREYDHYLWNNGANIRWMLADIAELKKHIR